MFKRYIVQVIFAGNFEVKYDFFTILPGLVPGDVVVCDTARGYSCGTVIGYIETSTKVAKWIVCPVPVEAHRQFLAAIRRQEKELEELLS